MKVRIRVDLGTWLLLNLARILVMLISIIPQTFAARVVLDGGLGFTWGEFTVEDVTATIKSDFFNPSILGEYRFGESETLAIGLGFSETGNEFSGDWTGDEGKYYQGEITVDRTSFDLYLRFLANEHFNFRLGYRYFRYEFSDGYLEKRQYGEYLEIAEHAKAKGNLTNGIDAEVNFSGGDKFQIRCGLGFSYFTNGNYTWSYDRTLFNPERHDTNQGDASQDALGVRFRPEMNYLVADNLRIRLEYLLSLAAWQGSTDQAEIEDYVGVDVYSAIGLGLEYQIPIRTNHQSSYE